MATKAGRIESVTRLRGHLVRAARLGIGWPAFRRLPLAPLRKWHCTRLATADERYASGDAFDLLGVDPSHIDRRILETAPRFPQWGRVVGGDWDRSWTPFDAAPIPSGIEARFDGGEPWHETPFREAFARQLSRFGVAWGYTSMADFDRRCAEIDRLYDRIRDVGYRTQDELVGRSWTTLARLDEINVDIGRDGRLYWRCCGQHRLAIARLLALDHVPVLVHRRHADWERIRERARRHGRQAIEPRYRSHPDIAREIQRGDGE